MADEPAQTTMMLRLLLEDFQVARIADELLSSSVSNIAPLVPNQEHSTTPN